MEKSKNSNIKRRKNATKSIKKKTEGPIQLIPAPKKEGVIGIVLIVLLSFLVLSVLYLGYNAANFIGDAKEMSETNPNWYCDDINEHYNAEICYLKSDDLNINSKGAYVYIMDCSWGEFAIKTTQEKITLEDKLFLRIHGCKIFPAE